MLISLDATNMLHRIIRLPLKCLTRHHSVNHILNHRKIDGEVLNVNGWIKTVRRLKNVTFIGVNDGSCLEDLQIVVGENLPELPVAASYGASVKVCGILKESSGRGQSMDVIAQSVEVLGGCDPQLYPFKAKKTHPVEYIRQYPHLRQRTSFFSSLLRVRNSLTQAVHQVLQDDGYIQIHTPILTSSDCEGAGEVFHVEPAKGKNTGECELTDINPHFFNTPAYLTVSGQLHLEAITSGFSRAYTFGPTFRAENSQGRHHLAEFYMLEAELAYLDDLQQLADAIQWLVHRTVDQVCSKAAEDIGWHWQDHGPQQCEDIPKKLTSPFVRLTYTEAIGILERHSKNFQFHPKWGCDLQKEHEHFLVRHCDNTPVFVVDFPADIKPFYMKLNPDSQTVAALDLLVPEVGELCGGSLRETNLEVLQTKIGEQQQENLQWYLDLRRFGSCPHGGYGLGFDRLLQVLLSIKNIRDVIPFPRSPNSCKM